MKNNKNRNDTIDSGPKNSHIKIQSFAFDFRTIKPKNKGSRYKSGK